MFRCRYQISVDITDFSLVVFLYSLEGDNSKDKDSTSLPQRCKLFLTIYQGKGKVYSQNKLFPKAWTIFNFIIFVKPFLRRLRKPVGRMTMQEQILEGEFRYVNSRIITNRFERPSPFYSPNLQCLPKLFGTKSILRCMFFIAFPKYGYIYPPPPIRTMLIVQANAPP